MFVEGTLILASRSLMGVIDMNHANLDVLEVFKCTCPFGHLG